MQAMIRESGDPMLGVQIKYSLAMAMPYFFSLYMQGVSPMSHDVWKPFIDSGVLGALTVVCIYFIRDTTKKLESLHDVRAAEAQRLHELRMTEAKSYSEKLERIMEKLNDGQMKYLETTNRMLQAVDTIADKRFCVYEHREDTPGHRG
mgnify:CR=1 FL=1